MHFNYVSGHNVLILICNYKLVNNGLDLSLNNKKGTDLTKNVKCEKVEKIDVVVVIENQ